MLVNEVPCKISVPLVPPLHPAAHRSFQSFCLGQHSSRRSRVTCILECPSEGIFLFPSLNTSCNSQSVLEAHIRESCGIYPALLRSTRRYGQQCSLQNLCRIESSQKSSTGSGPKRKAWVQRDQTSLNGSIDLCVESPYVDAWGNRVCWKNLFLHQLPNHTYSCSRLKPVSEKNGGFKQRASSRMIADNTAAMEKSNGIIYLFWWILPKQNLFEISLVKIF